MIKMPNSSPKSYQKNEATISMPVKKRAEQTIADYTGNSIISSQEPVKCGMLGSSDSKKGMMSSLWSTNSDRKSYDVKHCVSIK